MRDSLDPLWQKIITETPGHAWFVHGPDHWARVERNGAYLAQCLGLDDLIVRLFALLHDHEYGGGQADFGERRFHGSRAFDDACAAATLTAGTAGCCR